MTTDLLSTSIQLDTLIQEKFKELFTVTECQNASLPEIKTQLNSLKYLIYIINQDRLVNLIQMLRQSLIQLLPPSALLEKLPDKPSDYKYHIYDFYDFSGSSSEICTVINTSILPTSNDLTEREYSPFAISPLHSPQLVDNPKNLLTTETSLVKKRNEVLLTEDFIVSDSNSSEINISMFTTGSYIQKHFGDDEASPLWSAANEHSDLSSLHIKEA